MSFQDVHISQTIVLKSSPEQIWPLLADTDRINRLMNLPAFEEIEPDEQSTKLIHSHFFGIPVRWHEHPFKWVSEQWFEFRRVFEQPVPIKDMRSTVRLVPRAEGGSLVEVQITMQPRNLLGILVARQIIGARWLRDMLRVYQDFDKIVQLNQGALPPPRSLPRLQGDRLADGLRRLRAFPVAPQLAERLEQHLSSADDPDVLRMRPFALADGWGVPRLDVLRAFLYATRVGLMDLEWDVMCPSCRGPSVRNSRLAELSSEAHCPSCNIRYDLNFDEAVELRFSVNPAIRAADEITYCVGGPGRMPHVVAQVWLPPGGAQTLSLRMPAGVYHLRSRQLPARGALLVEPQAEAGEARAVFSAEAVEVDVVSVAAGVVTLHLENRSQQGLMVHLEQSAWTAQAASAALVTSMAEFRQLFAAEVLAPGMGLSVRNLTLLFSDLLGSTMIYDTVGDALAYARVRDHFNAMRGAIERHNGALVKTIGDAVMAVFISAEDAVEACFEIQHEFVAGEIAQGRPALKVKLGLHRGPCIAVNANNILDYFGSTVNIAARVQSESIGGDLVITPDVYSDPGVQRVLAREQAPQETFQRTLKGVSQGFTLYRIWPHPAGAELAVGTADALGVGARS
ncbi:MAG TPA: DUF5939 domain-containing protein [Roseiflexaceae bacterium]|nr:DUF5939 domain-containing protein [Roseiflexaceae bacterium]